jgi:hypothetical protein
MLTPLSNYLTNTFQKKPLPEEKSEITVLGESQPWTTVLSSAQPGNSLQGKEWCPICSRQPTPLFKKKIFVQTANFLVDWRLHKL